jgi:hypothetical protein
MRAPNGVSGGARQNPPSPRIDDGGAQFAEAGNANRRLGVSKQTCDRWKKQFSGLGLQEPRELVSRAPP